MALRSKEGQVKWSDDTSLESKNLPKQGASISKAKLIPLTNIVPLCKKGYFSIPISRALAVLISAFPFPSLSDKSKGVTPLQSSKTGTVIYTPFLS